MIDRSHALTITRQAELLADTLLPLSELIHRGQSDGHER